MVKDVPQAKTGSDAEDAGYLMTFVHDLGMQTTEFVIMDAQDFDRDYIARIKLPQRVPFGFHGNAATPVLVQIRLGEATTR